MTEGIRVNSLDCARNLEVPTLSWRTPHETCHFFEEQDVINLNKVIGFTNSSNRQQFAALGKNIGTQSLNTPVDYHKEQNTAISERLVPDFLD